MECQQPRGHFNSEMMMSLPIVRNGAHLPTTLMKYNPSQSQTDCFNSTLNESVEQFFGLEALPAEAKLDCNFCDKQTAVFKQN